MIPRRLVALAALATSAVLVLSGCAGSLTLSGGGQAAATSAAPAVPPVLTLSKASWTTPLTVGVSRGTLATVAVTDRATKQPLPGTVSTSSGSWVSDSSPQPGTSYDVSAVVSVDSGTTTLTGKVAVPAATSAEKLTFGIQPGSDATVGVNAPVVIRFAHAVTRRAAVEGALHVASTTPVVGAWHWISSTELHFRPQTRWPAHTQVRVTADLLGVQLSDTRFGSRDAVANFRTGDAHVVVVDDKAKTFTLSINGKVTYVWPTSLGRPEFVTRSGSYVVLEKDVVREMTSCGAKITCDKSSKDYYDLKVQWATRLSWSGTFIHAAPWSVAKQGLVDSSHGCIHLTIDRAKTFFDLAQYGDLVTVTHTGRPIGDLVSSGDPGATDWNTPWAAWVAGSALGAPVTSEPLTV